MNNIYRTLLALSFVFVAVSCGKEESAFTVPYAKVNFEIDLNGIDSDLRPFSSKVFTKSRAANEYVGYGGLLIFMSTDGVMYAYDLCCPYEDDKRVLVQPLNNGKAVCQKCGSSFILMYGLGTCESGSSKESLQRYQVLPVSHRSGVFYIRN